MRFEEKFYVSEKSARKLHKYYIFVLGFCAGMLIWIALASHSARAQFEARREIPQPHEVDIQRRVEKLEDWRLDKADPALEHMRTIQDEQQSAIKIFGAALLAAVFKELVAHFTRRTST